ncbi:MAG: hypothetical protein IH784_05905 [Bacteroidetes bacterium]|nr:hypothetical protein [Bacteroidota bacterium]
MGLAQHWQEIIDYSQTVVANIVSFLSYWELWKEKNESDDDEDFFYRRPDLATLHVQMYGEASANRIFAYRERLAWLLIYLFDQKLWFKANKGKNADDISEQWHLDWESSIAYKRIFGKRYV